MDQLIADATHSIDRLLASNSWEITDPIRSQLIETRNLLHQLLESDVPKNKWTELFSRQLKRLLNQNAWHPNDFWIQLHDDILYILEKLNGEQNKNDSWPRFLEKMKFESILEQRQLKFHQMFGERKSLCELLDRNEEFLQVYLQICISLHSTIEIRGLIENIDDLFLHNFEQIKILFTTDSKKRIEEKLHRLEIPFDCSNRSLNSVDSSLFSSKKSSILDDDNLNNFLPSLEQIKIDSERWSQPIENALQISRWLVILGDPGSAKTTLLRWITRIFAETVYRAYENIVLGKGAVHSLFRIPILIRIGEFAEWLVQHPTKTLIDYIGKHTWFSERYCDDECSIVLKELIYHGHALILLDGLDEISEVGQRKEIVELVRTFIDEYVREPDFISAFDEKMFSSQMTWHYGVMQPAPPITGGNQIVITSRIVGYQLYPLDSFLIEHYLLSLIDHKAAKQFVKCWITQIEKSILDVFSNEGISLEEKTVKDFSMRRYNAIETMFESGAELVLSNPFLLISIGTFIFQSSVEFRPKSRIEIYYHAVQASLHSWKNQQSTSISKSMLINFLIDLAVYLHLRSPSGLIDEFDMKQLCCLTFQRDGLSNNRTKLREYADELFLLLNSNVGMVAERSLQVFGFLHLSFQEYFVAQSFVRGSSIEDIANRILSFIINPRFRESLLLTIGWISWKWSFDDYEKFCKLLFTPTKDYTFPFGTILFFDAFNDLYRLPSNSSIFIALNSLLDHPSNIMAPTYLILNLSKLDKNIILEWVQVHFTDNKKRLLKFCQCLPISFNEQYRDIHPYEKLVIPLILQNLRMLYHTATITDEIIIDQFLRGLVKVDVQSDDNFNNQLLSYVSSELTNIHPLIFSVIIAVCGGIYFRPGNNGIMKIDFSTEQINRESTILSPIMDYFANTEEPHSIKIQTLIKEYENILENALPTNISLNIIDTFIALICLRGISQPLFYQKYHNYQALSLAIDRLKRTWFYLKKLYKNKMNLTSEVESIINVFFSQTDESIEHHMDFSLACAAAWRKLDIGDTSNWLKFKVFHTKNVNHYLKCQPEFISSTERSISTHLQTKNLSSEVVHQKLMFLLTFIPQSLQQLYYYTIIAPENATDSLQLVILLSQILILLETLSEMDKNVDQALSTLEPLFKEYFLENYALVLLGGQFVSRLFHKSDFKGVFKDIMDLNMAGYSVIDQPIDWEKLINTERQRIDYAKNAMENSMNDLRLFTSSISLARICQGQYRFHNSQPTIYNSLPSIEGTEIRSAIENIHDSVLQIIALSIILEMKNPPIFNNEQEEQLQSEMIRQLEHILPNLSLLKSTLLFIRCYSVHSLFSASFKLMTNVIGKKLIKTPFDKPNSDEEAVFIALQSIHDPDLFPYLSQFANRTKNISDLFQFNSAIFSQYFTHITDFHSSNTILLSSMYLVELAFDIQILKMYTNSEENTKIPSIDEFKQLWNDSPKYSYVMTFEVATWITNNLFMLNRNDIHTIILHISCCKMIERKALSVIQNWLDYQTDKDWKFFRHFAALQLVIEGSNTSSLIDIINEIFIIDRDFRLRDIVQQIFSSQMININILHQILIKLHENIAYSSNIYARIERKEIFELVLSLELKRIIANERQPSTFTRRSYLLMIKGYSKDLQIYLIEYLRLFFDFKNEINNSIKEKFLSILIKWITMYSVAFENKQILSMKFYEYIFTFLDNSQFPQIQKAVFDALNSLFIFLESSEENILIQNIAFSHMIKIINSYAIYSEDILSICLLAFGNCLLKLNTFEKTIEISNETLNIFIHLFKTSSSEIISIRAAFCFIFTQYSNITSDTIQNWFRNQLNITVEKKYQILLQQTLYKNKKAFDDLSMELTTIHKHKYSTEMMDKFVLDFYNYLSKEHNDNHFSFSTPTYFFLVKELIEEDFKVFQNAVQKSSFGEENFRKVLSCCFPYLKGEIDATLFVNLYAIFGTITMELVHMLESSNISFDDHMWNYFDNIKRVSNQDVIEKLFEVLDFMLINIEFIRFSFILRLLVQLAQVHLVSLFEIHQHISNVIENLSSDQDYIDQIDKNKMFQYLLDLSCAKQTKSILSKIELITQKDIDNEFDNELNNINKRSVLFLRRNYFLKEFRTIFTDFVYVK